MPSSPPESEPLIRLLWRAHNWFRAALTTAFEAQEDGSAISAAHVTLLSQLPSEGASIAELARRLGVSAPTAHQWVHELVAMGVVTVESDPRSARSKLVLLSAAGVRRRAETMQILAGLEAALAGRVGADTVTALRAALEEPWGSPESAVAELPGPSTP
ncbi:MarR family winged helix-turn-helix transcriptional regulator [Streptomyces coeruleorubidus]|uniref:MarR family winged helix-turn-helix transcriptional regulator n=1 Tax=Streptomyces coeruleorubidus TaxID=116188 RepID=UPI00237F90D1|nr:MarR family winged helix-turn-helix transcriptional regulator [Streptomyces coeruleorubidus]WDV49919.1 MarR family winged helix-turn-helix transcriptional regulator [Streptomyces coeruleorubidus]